MIDGLLADPDLLALIIAAGADPELSDLAESDQVAAIDLGLSCLTSEEISASIQAGFDADVASQALAGQAADCVGERVGDKADPDRSQLLLGLVAIGEDRQPTPAQGDLLVDLMVECIDPGFMVDATLASVVDDPLIDAALDRACLDTAIGNDAYLEQFWGLFVANTNAEFEQLPPDQQALIVGPFFECVSFGTVIAASAAEDGVDLSEGTITCIDDAIDPAELVDAFLVGGAFDESEFVSAILPCLSLEELGDLGG